MTKYIRTDLTLVLVTAPLFNENCYKFVLYCWFAFCCSISLFLSYKQKNWSTRIHTSFVSKIFRRTISFKMFDGNSPPPLQKINIRSSLLDQFSFHFFFSKEEKNHVYHLKHYIHEYIRIGPIYPIMWLFLTIWSLNLIEKDKTWHKQELKLKKHAVKVSLKKEIFRKSNLVRKSILFGFQQRSLTLQLNIQHITIN